MKKFALILTSLILSITSFSQGKYGATPEDSITCIESLIYKDYLKSEPKLALELWKVAYKVCPQSQKTLYINGVKMYKAMALKAPDAEQKAAYLDTMYSIYDRRIEMFGQRGMVLGQRGQSMLSFKQDKEETYKVLNEAMTLTGNKTQSGTLVAMMFTVINLEKAGKKSKEEVVLMFEKTLAICAINKDKPKTGARYIKAETKIQNVTSPYLDCAVLIPLAEKNFEANKDNVDWLRRTTKLLKSKKCYEADIFSKVAEAYFKLEPSAQAASGMGNLFLGKRDFAKAIEFFKKAVEMAETDEDKAENNFSIAQAYSYSKKYSQARSFALKAAGFKKGWGAPYLLIGDCYAQSSKSCNDGDKGVGRWGVYWAAVDKYRKAKSVDPSVASTANKKIASISSRFPTVQDVFFLSLKDGTPYQLKCWINESTTVKLKK